jgi:hypothetical protein
MPLSRATRLVTKAEAALLSAIEVYNRLDFKYREETFAILVLNAWELLLKAKLLQDNNNDPRCLRVYDTRTASSGRKTTRTFVRRNRSGNPFTKTLRQVIAALDNTATSGLARSVKTNLDALVEVRDNAVHFVNASKDLSKQVLEIGTASIMNFAELARRWFGRDLSQYSLYLLPVGFFGAPTTVTAITTTADENRLITYLTDAIRAADTDEDNEFHVALEVNLSMRRSIGATAGAVNVTNDPNAPEVIMSEEDIRRTYRWDYKELVRRAQARYSDFKVNREFHSLRESLIDDRRYVKTRLLDPANPKSGKKNFYSPNIINEFDGHYARRLGKSRT